MDALHERRLVADHLAAGRAADAARLAAAALELFPDDAPLWLAGAEAERRLGNFDSARRALEHAALLVPLDGRTQCRLAECYAKSGNAQAARAVLDFLADDPDCPDALLPELAAAFGQLGASDRALAVCCTAADRQPDEAAPQFGAAYYLQRLGYPPAAIIPWAQRAFDLEPETPVYRTSLALLLAEAGREEEAYDLLRELPLSACGCPCRIRRMMALFRAVGDHVRFCECSEHLRYLRHGAE